MKERVMLLEGDVLAALKLLPDSSFDALYSDVPYGLGPKQPTGEELIAYLQGAEMDTAGDFMGKKWHVPSVSVWREAFRVLKPGAPVLINVAPRTEDLVAIGMRAGGFEIADMMMWMFAEAMVKNHNISKAIDKKAGAKREVVGTQVLTGNAGMSTKEKGGTYGVGVGTAPAKTIQITAPATALAKAWAGHGTALAPGYEPVIVGWKPNEGTYVQNITTHGVGGLNIDECRIGDGSDFEGEREDEPSGNKRYTENGSTDLAATPGDRGGSPKGRWPKNLIIDEAVGDMLDAQAGDDHPGMSGGGTHRPEYGGGMFGAIDSTSTARGDNGGPSRFYYCAKSSKVERDLGCDGLPLHYPAETVKRKEGSVGINNGRAGAGRTGEGVRNPHPNVKPISLCKYLATLALPPPGDSPRRLLNIYSGSGSEAVGSTLAGWDEIVCVDRDQAYCTIARARIAHAVTFPHIWEALLRGDLKKPAKTNPKQVSMFDTNVSLPLALPPAPPPPPALPPAPVTVVSAPMQPGTIGIREEMPMSELAKRLAEKGYLYTLAEIASWDTDKRLRAAKYARGETP